MIDYVEEYAANQSALTFWGCVFGVMNSTRCSVEKALEIVDSTGEQRVMYPRPADFPDCFKESA